MTTATEIETPRRVWEAEYIPSPEEIRAGCLAALAERKTLEARTPSGTVEELFRKQRHCSECGRRMRRRGKLRQLPVMGHKTPFTLICHECAQRAMIAEYGSSIRC